MLWFGLLMGCTNQTWSNADLQVDITGTTWDTEERARLCVEGVGVLEEAMATGRIAFTGIPDDTEVVLIVDVLIDGDTGGSGSRRGRAGPISFADGSWQTTAWQDCKGDCPACTTAGSRAESDGQLLAVRFQ